VIAVRSHDEQQQQDTHGRRQHVENLKLAVAVRTEDHHGYGHDQGEDVKDDALLPIAEETKH
jgi:hypothetical protein